MSTSVVDTASADTHATNGAEKVLKPRKPTYGNFHRVFMFPLHPIGNAPCDVGCNIRKKFKPLEWMVSTFLCVDKKHVVVTPCPFGLLISVSADVTPLQNPFATELAKVQDPNATIYGRAFLAAQYQPKQNKQKKKENEDGSSKQEDKSNKSDAKESKSGALRIQGISKDTLQKVREWLKVSCNMDLTQKYTSLKGPRPRTFRALLEIDLKNAGLVPKFADLQARQKWITQQVNELSEEKKAYYQQLADQAKQEHAIKMKELETNPRPTRKTAQSVYNEQVPNSDSRKNFKDLSDDEKSPYSKLAAEYNENVFKPKMAEYREYCIRNGITPPAEPKVRAATTPSTSETNQKNTKQKTKTEPASDAVTQPNPKLPKRKVESSSSSSSDAPAKQRAKPKPRSEAASDSQAPKRSRKPKAATKASDAPAIEADVPMVSVSA